MKKMTGIIAMAVLSSAAFANTIVPETSRDGKTKNASAIAVTTEHRTFVAGEYNSATVELDGGAETDTTNMNVYGGWANKMFTIEADLNMEDEDDAESTEYGVQAAYRINKQFALGLGFSMTDNDDTDVTGQDIEIAGSYAMNDLLIGASYTIQDENTDADGSNGLITLGVGSNANNMSWEAGLKFRMDDEDSGVGSRTELFAGATKVINNIEFDGDLSFETGDNNFAGGDYSAYAVNFDAEFIVAEKFYVTPGFMYSFEDEDGSETTMLNLSGDFGYRANKIDATVGLDYGLMGESNDTDFDYMAWKVNVAYLF